MSIYEQICIGIILVIIVIMICKLCDAYNKKFQNTDKALLELYDRIADLEKKLNDNK